MENILHDDDKLILVEDFILEDDGKEVFNVALEHPVHTLQQTQNKSNSFPPLTTFPHIKCYLKQGRSKLDALGRVGPLQLLPRGLTRGEDPVDVDGRVQPLVALGRPVVPVLLTLPVLFLLEFNDSANLLPGLGNGGLSPGG